jgi:hypothetical protein
VTGARRTTMPIDDDLQQAYPDNWEAIRAEVQG